MVLLAASYSGERAFEVCATSDRMVAVWKALEAAVLAAGGALYGLEALELLHIEKGHIVIGVEASGRTTPGDLGLAKLFKTKGVVGELDRPAFADPDRPMLVGLEADRTIPEGAMLLPRAGAAAQGYVTSAGARVLGDGGIALGLLAGGMARARVADAGIERAGQNRQAIVL